MSTSTAARPNPTAAPKPESALRAMAEIAAQRADRAGHRPDLQPRLHGADLFHRARELEAFPKLPDQGATWYYWKLAEPTTMSRITSWGFYLAQQFIIWGLIWYAQKHVRKYTPGLHMVNIVALAVNATFVVLHYFQTHIWYDGIAQDVHIFTSQWSVIIMLIWIMLMESRTRGLAFGKKVGFSKGIVQFARKYHGYYFAWAIIYTYWFHPMEGTPGHLLGFFYTFMLLLQGSLFFTRLHVNKWWMVLMEVTVLAHGTIVAIVQGNNLWPMFLFGFLGVFVVTQMWGLNLRRPVAWAFLALLHRRHRPHLEPARPNPVVGADRHPDGLLPGRVHHGRDLRRGAVDCREGTPPEGGAAASQRCVVLQACRNEPPPW